VSRFFVGQRVRTKDPRNKWCTHMQGNETVICGQDSNLGGEYWILEGTSLRGRGVGVYKHEAGDYLEPIQPEGMRHVDWEECLWQPEHLRESAHG
jgi:hypothetical protein